jgi:hypothetical protein
MPTYFFDLSKGDLLLRDHAGLVLADIQVARHEALKELILLATEDFRSEDDSRVDVRDYQGNVLLTVTAGSRASGPPADGSSIKLTEWSREAAFAADLARWAEEQRAIIRELASTGRDVSTAEDLLKSITNLYADKVAARILKRVTRKDLTTAGGTGTA